MEEAAQILEIETFIPLLLQVTMFVLMAQNFKSRLASFMMRVTCDMKVVVNTSKIAPGSIWFSQLWISLRYCLTDGLQWQ